MSAECFFCGLDSADAHPTCDRPDCTNHVHGYGPEGKTTRSYCPEHTTADVGGA